MEDNVSTSTTSNGDESPKGRSRKMGTVASNGTSSVLVKGQPRLVEDSSMSTLTTSKGVRESPNGYGRKKGTSSNHIKRGRCRIKRVRE